MNITCRYEIGTGYGNRNVFRIIESTSNVYYVGRTLDFGFMEIAITEGYKITLTP